MIKVVLACRDVLKQLSFCVSSFKSYRSEIAHGNVGMDNWLILVNVGNDS